MKSLATAVLIAASFSVPLPAQAADHLFNASISPGAAQRGYANPITDNPHGKASSVSNGDAAPGTGDPKVGEDLGTPAVEPDALNPTAQEHVPFGE